MEIGESSVSLMKIHCETAAKLNFAAHQSAFAFLKAVRLECLEGARVLGPLVVELTSDPCFLKPKTWRVERLIPGESVALQDRDVELSGEYLQGLTDAVTGRITIQVRQGEEVLASETRPVELLAFNEWGGAGYMPELLAAFSLPNDTAVDKILHEASLVLRKAGKKDGLDGYGQRSRERVWEIVSAIYTVICNQGITYALPPTSFEKDGQKIRLPSQILSGKVATCLDSTMLFAAAFEQAGLNPIVVMPKGHALVGVWLQPEELSTIVLDEPEVLRKRVQLKEMILIETTLATSSKTPPFSKAIEIGIESIPQELDSEFVAAVDIRRARAHKIRPLGNVGVVSNADSGSQETTLEVVFEAAPTLPDFDQGLDTPNEERPETPAGRLERWQRKLLDLSAQNPLLNHRATKGSLSLVCPDPGVLEDKLAAGDRISIQAMTHPTGKAQDEEIHRQRTGEVISKEYALAALDKNQILVQMGPEELTNRAVEIYRKAQSALQEGGANTLYLAIGFLSWKHSEKDERRFRAPLILLPVVLDRKSARSGFTLVSHDDETRINTTLLEMLRKDFQIDIQGMDGALPTDHSGVDVRGIWEKVRLAIKSASGFEVVEDVVLGNFSFAKYLMWKDLVDRADALRECPIVKHLIETPKEPYQSKLTFVDGRDVDANYSPADLLTPLPADASQMSVVATADKGKDFIVIGPPGTGKSQTIGNLIAHAIGKGKTVLFVSEKTAALDVVHRRLHDVGLGRFCLELHSNKARKTDVLDQLKKTWDLAASSPPVGWELEALRLKNLRDKLNGVVTHLHQPHRNGLTPHYAIGVKIRDERLATRILFSWSTADHHDQAQLDTMRDTARSLGTYSSVVADLTTSPLKWVEDSEWSPAWEAKLVESAEQFSEAARQLDLALDDLLGKIGIRVADRSFVRIDSLGDFALALLDTWRKHGGFALGADGIDRIDALEEAVGRLKAYADLQSGLSCAYEPFAWRTIDGVQLAGRWNAAVTTWWPSSFFAKRALLKELAVNGARGVPDPVRDAPILTSLRGEGEAIDRLDRRLSSLRTWNAHNTAPEAAAALRDDGLHLRKIVSRLADESASLVELQSAVRRLLEEGNDLLAPDASVGQASRRYLDAHGKFCDALERIEQLSGRGLRNSLKDDPLPLERIGRIGAQVAANRANLKDWCAWRRIRAEALKLELDPLVSSIESGKIPAREVELTFEAAYCTWWSGAVISEDPVLRSFSALEHEDSVRRFRELDDHFQKLTASYIAAKLCATIPGPDGQVGRSSWGTLRREIQKKSRHKPVRQLVQEIPDVLGRLAPCLMMSPLSVAQYLPANQSLFDLVIFDEASQITVWDAVGALARGRQAVVAGDPKQMPPTNFFARSSDDSDEDVDVEGDLESILDELEGASIPRSTLNLHYRSRKESLIAFSNSRYYGNGLVTFPAPVAPDRGIRLVRPGGFYARGGARHNQGEAEAIVAEILRRLKSRDPDVRNASIGVVTFNSEQQTLIENLLDKARQSEPEVEWAFSRESTLEPVFVKNLETVQGDERDVILFSVTYGPDQGGHVTMNLGPLNRSGGERRLNVALTRARSELVVFSTLSPDRIDLSRTQAKAVTDLKHFLEYAESGPGVLGRLDFGSKGDMESPFEVAVAEGLKRKGWTIHPQVGISAYRIDLGIVHPDHPGLYLAGVECDGAMYHSSAFARERDNIRQGVLERLGWKLFRVWSTDWWNNPAKSMDILHVDLEGHLERDRTKRASKAEAEENARLDQDVRSSVIEADLGTREPTASPLGTGIEPEVMPLMAAKQVSPASLYQPLMEGDATISVTDYVVTDLGQESLSPNADLFYLEEYSQRLTSMVKHVIDSEGPIHEDVLIRRIARHHGFMKAGIQIRNTILGVARDLGRQTEETWGTYYWPTSSTFFRSPARSLERDEEMRKVDHICREELQAIAAALSINKDPLELARALGIARLAKVSKARLCDALGVPVDPSDFGE